MAQHKEGGRESKCSAGGCYWKDIIEEEFINPWGFSRPRLDSSEHQRREKAPLQEAAGVGGRGGQLRHWGPAPHPETKCFETPPSQQWKKTSPAGCADVCLGPDPRPKRWQMMLWCWLETLTASVCFVQCSPGAVRAKVQTQPAGCRGRALEEQPWPAFSQPLGCQSASPRLSPVLVLAVSIACPTSSSAGAQPPKAVPGL